MAVNMQLHKPDVLASQAQTVLHSKAEASANGSHWNAD
jgi:hypothetical protein